MKWLIPISSNEDLRLPWHPIFGNPWRNELDLRKSISFSIWKRDLTSVSLRKIQREKQIFTFTRSELLLPRFCPNTVGLSGNDNEFAFVAASGGFLLFGFCPPIIEPRLDDEFPAPARLIFEQNDMFDFRRELWRSKVLWAENGDGRTMYLK